MMRVLICDLCGHESRSKGIVGNEFNIGDFKTLGHAYRMNGVVDVCGKCFVKIKDEVVLAEKNSDNLRKKEVKSALFRLVSRKVDCCNGVKP